MNAKELFHAGDLDGAVNLLVEQVKKSPADVPARSLLCEMLCFAGNLDRADLQLDAIGKQDIKAAAGVSLFRHLLRAEQARQQFYVDGRLPDFLSEPTPVMQLHLQASIRIREGNLKEAADILAEAETQRIHVKGTCDGKAFDDFRDLDDLCASYFEVLTSTGKYYWIPVERMVSIEFETPARPIDLLWRPAEVTVHDGPEGKVYFPTLYAGTSAQTDKQLRLGRATDWQANEEEPVRGLGQRTFLFGEDARTILEVGEISFDHAEGGEQETVSPEDR